MRLTWAILALAASSVHASPSPKQLYAPQCCAADRCFQAARIPAKSSSSVSEFCKKYIHSTPTTQTKMAKNTVTVTITPAPSTVTVPSISVTTSISTVSTACSATTEVSYPTVTYFRVRGSDPAPFKKRQIDEKREDLEARGTLSRAPAIPSYLTAGCKAAKVSSAVSSACHCYLKSPCTTVTPTVSVTLPAGDPVTVTSISASTSSDVTTVCTTTVTSSVVNGQLSCGVDGPTPGAVGTPTCANDNTPPGETNSPFRIEGGSEGNIYEGCIVSGPRNITTPSGGTHLCDGTNNNGNPAPGGTFTTDIDSAARQEGFGFDGTWSAQVQDFHIETISDTVQAGNQYWAPLRNRVFVQNGGCGEEVSPSDEALWAFDAYAPNRVFLSTSPGYEIVSVGTMSITVTILAGNPNSGNTIPAQGASFGQSGRVAGSDGSLIVDVPALPGCYLFKAELTNAIRSNTFYLGVV